MNNSYYILTKFDDNSQKKVKLWDNGDGTFSTQERRAVDVGVSPAGVGAGIVAPWPTTRQGIPFMVGGHPNIQTKNFQITAAEGGQVGTAIVAGAVGKSIIVTKITVNTANTNSGDTSVRIGFGESATPNPDDLQVLFYQSAMDASQSQSEGSGAGVIGIGAENESLRLSCTSPTGGDLNIVVTYWI